MPNSYFRFKQFTINHERCAMKVGTDGVLLGAWADIIRAKKVLDIGTGTGLIALMVAQRSSKTMIDGIDIDAEAVLQAKENVNISPWKERISIKQADVREMECTKTYDAIVSNPPFFVEKTHCLDEQRNAARHASALTFENLLDAVKRMLKEGGTFSVVLPASAYDAFVALAAVRHLYINRCTWVYTKPNVSPKRVLMEFGTKIQEWTKDELYIMDAPPAYSKAYRELTQDFYLNF